MNDTSGPAFPDPQVDWRGENGMSLRDYFAAKAMQALVTCNDEESGDRLTEIPTYAYDIADEMLKARKS
jgi:hypothetical protein